MTDPVLGDGLATYTPGVSERRSGTSRYLHSGIKNADSRTTGQAVEATREYDAFGNVLSQPSSWEGPFGYAGGFGYQEDGDTGLKLLGHRHYDPTTGRFLTRDPISSGRNWYGYCANDPTGNVDRDGRIPAAVVAGIAHEYLNPKGCITITVHQRGFGHASLIVRYPDKRGTMVVENVMSGNVRVGDGWANPDVPSDLVTRTKPFDPKRFPHPQAMMTGFPGEYNLTTNQCVDFAAHVWELVTGEALDVRLPGSLQRTLQDMNERDRNRGGPKPTIKQVISGAKG